MSFNKNQFALILNDAVANNAVLVAVSKTQTVETIKEAYDAGQKIFGENYVQELVDKHQELPKDIQWHFIGHLQSNKVKLIAPFVSLIHGVDSLKLLKEIDKEAKKINHIIPCLLQLHIAREETKFGLSFDEAEEILNSAEFSELKNIKVDGFMGMATLTDNEQQMRKEFHELKSFFDRMNSKFKIQNSKFRILSMGMTSDYTIALQEGSNMIRIGSAIFGARG